MQNRDKDIKGEWINGKGKQKEGIKREWREWEMDKNR